MRTSIVRLLFVLLLLAPATVFAQTFTVPLSGANEVPSGDPDGSGIATVTFNGTTVTYTIVVSNITLPPTGQHIHSGAAGINGPIVIDLAGTWVGGTLNGSTTTTQAQVNAILANPAGFYVNVNTSDFPGGAIRGQMSFSQVPTMSTWMLVALAAALAIAGAILIRR